MKRLIYLVLFIGGIIHAEETKTIVNPFTGKIDYITKLTSATIPSGSTQYIQNTLSPTTTTQVFSVMSGTFTGRIDLANGTTVYFASGAKIDTVGTTIRLWPGGTSDRYVSINSDGTLFPNLDGFQDLGTGSNKWRNLKADAWTAGNGSSQFPSINFANSTSMGFWSRSSSYVGLSLSNTQSMEWVHYGGTPSKKQIHYYNETSINQRPVLVHEYDFSDTTDATRKGRSKWQIVDTSSRTFLQVDTDGTAPYTTFTGSVTFNSPVFFSTYTASALSSLTPSTTWQYVTCVDCSAISLCVSTGSTNPGQWASAVSKTTACQ